MQHLAQNTLQCNLFFCQSCNTPTHPPTLVHCIAHNFSSELLYLDKNTPITIPMNEVFVIHHHLLSNMPLMAQCKLYGVQLYIVMVRFTGWTHVNSIR